MAVFLLAPELMTGIVAHARAGYPEEVCGLIAGPDTRVSPGSLAEGRAVGFMEDQVVGRGLELYRGRNVAPDPRNHFALDVDTLARQIEFAERGLSVSAIYHSHPYGPEAPSSEDIEQASYPHAVYIICSLAQPDRAAVRGFLISNESASEVRLLQAFDNGGKIE